jgi:ubiquinone/menaquinone biosynthesis C-methylase UbiE
MYGTGDLLGDIRSQVILKTISDLMPESFLDVGCAEGFYLQMAAKSPGDSERYVVGLDIARSYLDKAYRDGHTDLILADSACLPLRDMSFDTVLCSEVLEHMLDPTQSLAELARVCKRWIIITTPTHTVPYYLLKAVGEQMLREFRSYEPFSSYGLGGGHITELTLANLHNWSQEHGFSAIEEKVLHSFGAPPLPKRPYHFTRSVIAILDKLVNLLPLSVRRGTVQFALFERKS